MGRVRIPRAREAERIKKMINKDNVNETEDGARKGEIEVRDKQGGKDVIGVEYDIVGFKDKNGTVILVGDKVYRSDLLFGDTIKNQTYVVSEEYYCMDILKDRYLPIVELDNGEWYYPWSLEKEE